MKNKNYNPKISIIVPVYNVEKYISRCLDSLINQSYKNIEIIIINDGSTDSSSELINKYKKVDTRIKSYYKKNGGLSSARNYGLSKISGDYIMFVDSDDYLDLDALKILINHIDGYDIVCFNYSITTDSLVKDYYPRYYSERDVQKNYILTQPSACTKIYHKNLFLNNNLKFDEGIHYEDLALIPSLVLYTNKIKFINNCLYHYYIRDNSIMHHNNFSTKIDDKFIALNNLLGRFDGKFSEELSFLIIKQLCIVYITEISKYGKNILKPRIKKVNKYLNDNDISIFSNYYFKRESFTNKIFITMVFYNLYFSLKILTDFKNKIIFKENKNRRV